MKIHCAYDSVVPIPELKLHPKNRNVHPQEQLDRLAKILDYQGWRYPVKVSKRSGYVTSGHGRIEAAKINKWHQIPVSFQEYESDEQEYADLTADNAIASWAELDLSGINTDLPAFGPELDIDMLGLRGFLVDPSELDPMKEWDGMPEFDQDDKTGYQRIQVHFFDRSGVVEFAKLIGQPITEKTRTVWYPDKIIERAADKVYGD